MVVGFLFLYFLIEGILISTKDTNDSLHSQAHVTIKYNRSSIPSALL